MKTEKVAQILGLSKSTILRWIYTGLIKDVTRDKRGWRVWSNEDVQRAIRFKNTFWGINSNSSQSFLREWRSNRALSVSMFRPDKYIRMKNKEKEPG